MPVVTRGCGTCGVTWRGEDDSTCWRCDGPAGPNNFTSLRDQNSLAHPAGMKELINLAREAGSVLADDPCGGGPL